MTKEKIIYRFRYEEPYSKRRKQPYLDRNLQLLKEVRYANSLRSYQVVSILTVKEMLEVQELVEGKFPFRVLSSSKDQIGNQIISALKRIRES